MSAADAREDERDEAWLLARARGESAEHPDPARAEAYVRLERALAGLTPPKAREGWQAEVLAAIDRDEGKAGGETEATAGPATPPAAQPASAQPASAQPSATPASAQSAATPASAKPAATPASAKPAATPASAQPASAQPSATPASAQSAATPASAKPAATPASAKPAATPASAKPAAARPVGASGPARPAALAGGEATPWRATLVPIAAVLALAALVLLFWKREAELPGDAIALSFERADVRGEPAAPERGAVGDTYTAEARLEGEGELRVYRSGGELVLRCPGDAGCSEDKAGGRRVLRGRQLLKAPGVYRVYVLSGPRVPPPLGRGENDDVTAAQAAGVLLSGNRPFEVK